MHTQISKQDLSERAQHQSMQHNMDGHVPPMHLVTSAKYSSVLGEHIRLQVTTQILSTLD